MDGEAVVYRFGRFELDPGLRELRSDGEPVPLQPQPYRALELLAAAAGRVVTREDFIAALWEPGTHVDYDRGIISTIRRLRVVLGEDARRPAFIRTVPGHGYRFVGATRTAASADVIASPRAGSGVVAAAAPHRGKPRGWSTRRWVATAASGLLTVAAVAAIGTATRDRGGSTLIAVLPMEVSDSAGTVTSTPSRSGLAEALTEQIAIELARLHAAGVRVIAPQSARRFAERDLSLESVRTEYGVTLVLRRQRRAMP